MVGVCTLSILHVNFAWTKMSQKISSRLLLGLTSLYCLKRSSNFSTVALCQCKNDFYQWSEKWFETNQSIPQTPVFSCKAENISILKSPEVFYEQLKVLSSTAKQRITLASLYLGNGKLEQQLVDTIYENMDSSSNPPKLRVLLEYTRGSRGTHNSRTMLLPIVKDFTKDTEVSLFHTPNLRGVLRRLIPERFNETINVAHLKVYLFDSTLIMSGANLSNDYFTNRQDRYIIIKDCKELCDYLDELVQTISKFSFLLHPDDNVQMQNDFPYHPYKSPKNEFNTAAGKLLTDFMTKHSNTNFFTADKIKQLQENNTMNTPPDSVDDTLIFPLLQMHTMGIQQDETVTNNMLASAPQSASLVLATAYFNLTDEYWKSICENESNNDLIMAHPKAMGFYQAAGMAGGIPNAYSLIASRHYKHLTKLDHTDKTKFYEFHRTGWTFHGKGLWAHIKDDSNSPLVTLIGSPNFGKRSVYRDMESQLAIVTVNKKLKEQLLDERDNLWEHSTRVTQKTFEEDERAPKWWVWGIATFMNDFF